MQFIIDRYFPDETQSGGDSGIASFEEKRPLYLAGSRRFLAHYREKIKELHRQGTGGIEVVAEITAMTDMLIEKLYNSILGDMAEKSLPEMTLVTVGGYGRGELNPFSDIDIMFLHAGKNPQAVEEVSQKLLYFLWDMKLDVGYSVRTVNDCIEMGKADSTVRTAMLDSRFLVGSKGLYDSFWKSFQGQLLSKGSDSYINDKLSELETRRGKYGSSVYILEPNIKESEGGLRDIQTAIWVAKLKYKITAMRELVIKGIISEEELEAFETAKSYLWRIRNELHYLAGRKKDQITFEAQISLAEFFGFKDRGKSLAVEEFMQDYYLQATKTEHLSASLISRCKRREESPGKILGYFIRRPLGDGLFVVRGELTVPDESVIDAKPALLMTIFEQAQKQGVKLSVDTKSLIRNKLDQVNDKFRRSKEVNNSFFNILRADKGVVETLKLMHHLEFLNHFIPEFERIHCKVQHDLYHVFTVDIHTLFCVEEIVSLWQGEHAKDLPDLTALAAEVQKRELLLLAVLFHDIGKGEGGGHAEKGAVLCRTIARRMGLSKEDSERLEFLVRQHLLFAHIAQRRDLHDERMIIDFARQMESSENLKMLYLLTYADVKGVGPDVWNDWKKMLFRELFEKSFQVLERGDFRLEASSERVKAVRRKVITLLENDLPLQSAKEELKALTTRHTLSNAPEDIATHVKVLHMLDSLPLVIEISHKHELGFSHFTIATRDMPALFAKITGVMAANGINILGAQIHTGTNGKALDILQVNSPQGFVITDENRWNRIKGDMQSVLEGKVQVQSLVDKRKKSNLSDEKQKPRFPTRVEIDNEVSVDYSVIDIYTHDKVGLLYRITATLSQLGLYIGVAKISTKVDQVADVFYVRDIFGQKIIGEEKLEEIKKRLQEAIDS
ncbi:MAG: [protein-PII] uridylyltransferase [Geobacteraceae bacterium]|nr:[protein-PII] uridylyltransferase [Geobacteraceae bacterium]